MPHVVIYSDGSFKKSYNAGGWSCLLTCGSHWKLIAAGEKEITVNRAELTAVMKALEQLTCPCSVDIYSDSMYTVNCINKWIDVWERNNWMTQAGDQVLNQDLLYRIRDLMYIHQVKAFWVKAHTRRRAEKYLGNAVVDSFAQMGSIGKF